MPIRGRTSIVAAAMACLAAASDGWAQTGRLPVSLDLAVGLREAMQGDAVPVTVRLRNFKDEAVAAPRPVDVTIESDLLRRPTRLTIPSAASVARAEVVFDRAGIAQLKASAAGLASAYAAVAIRPARRSSAVLPSLWPALVDAVASLAAPVVSAETLSGNGCGPENLPPPAAGLWLASLPPRVNVRNGRWTSNVIVALVNDRREPTPALQDISVRLAPTLGTVAPDEIVVAKGSSTAQVRITSTAAGCDTVYAWSPMVTAAGVPNVHVEYERSRPARLSISPTAPEAVANGWTTVPIAVVLHDDDGHVVQNPDDDLRVLLRSSVGTLSKSAVTIARGRSDSDEVLLSSRRRGRATISAIAQGMQGDDDVVTFVLPWLLIPLSIGGGIAGAVLRAPRRKRAAQLAADLALGGVLGFVVFGFTLFGVPSVVPGLPADTLENLALNELGAALLGLVGGYLGRRYLENLLATGSRPRSAAAAA